MHVLGTANSGQDDELWQIRKRFLDGCGRIDKENGKNFQLVCMWTNIAECYYRGMKLGYLDKDLTQIYIDQISNNFRADKDGYIKHLEMYGNNDFTIYMKKSVEGR